MSSSDKFKLLALDSLEIMSGCLLTSMKETQQLAKLNASLIRLAKSQCSGSAEALALMECPEAQQQKLLIHDSQDGAEWQPVLFQQMNRALDLAFTSLEALVKNQDTLDKSIHSKQHDNEELKLRFEEQRRQHEIELQRRDDRISQLSLQLEEKILMETKREISQEDASEVLGCGDGNCREKTSIEKYIKEIHNYLIATDQSGLSLKVCDEMKVFEVGRNQNDEDRAQAILLPENNIEDTESDSSHLSDMDSLSTSMTVPEEPTYDREPEIGEFPSSTTLIATEEPTSDQEPEIVEYPSSTTLIATEEPTSDREQEIAEEASALWADQVELPSESEYSESCDTSDKDPEAESQNDSSSTPTRYPPIRLYPLGTAPPTNRPRRTRETRSKFTDPKRTVYVGKLHPSIDDMAIEAAFNECFEVTKICFKARPSNSFAFVELKTSEMAKAAISMTEFWIGERKYRIGPVKGTDFKIKVQGFAPGTDSQALRRVFGIFGQIQRIFLQSKSCVVIHYSEKRSAEEAAAKLNNLQLAGNMTLKVRTCFK